MKITEITDHTFRTGRMFFATNNNDGYDFKQKNKPYGNYNRKLNIDF